MFYHHFGIDGILIWIVLKYLQGREAENPKVSYHPVWSAIRGQGMNFPSFVRKRGQGDKPEAKLSKSHNQK